MLGLVLGLGLRLGLRLGLGLGLGLGLAKSPPSATVNRAKLRARVVWITTNSCAWGQRPNLYLLSNYLCMGVFESDI